MVVNTIYYSILLVKYFLFQVVLDDTSNYGRNKKLKAIDKKNENFLKNKK